MHKFQREFGLSLEDYYGGSFLLAWDRTPDNCNRYHRHKMGSGTIDINIKTGTALTETVTVIVYATYSSDIIIENACVLLTTFKKCGHMKYRDYYIIIIHLLAVIHMINCQKFKKKLLLVL